MAFTVNNTMPGKRLIESVTLTLGLASNHLPRRNGLLGAMQVRNHIEGFRSPAHDKKLSRLRCEAFFQFGQASALNQLERRDSLKRLRKIQRSFFFIPIFNWRN